MQRVVNNSPNVTANLGEMEGTNASDCVLSAQHCAVANASEVILGARRDIINFSNVVPGRIYTPHKLNFFQVRYLSVFEEEERDLTESYKFNL